MSKVSDKIQAKLRRQYRVRSRVKGTSERPRLSVSVSNLHVSAQIIDDVQHKTLASFTTVGLKAKGTMTEKAELVGEGIAKKAKAAKISHVVFDRGARIYHGRVKALAEAARKSGLEF
ncbi:50S ribosomal protein L18 [Candidatus Saccharibacteria bacterium]|jgi:large subunit ribosomal protein L18|nr:50S ribosomal protein L18 [Candidatus Saccharibacteria bacterium]